ncbi:MAG: DUF4365 domain-containing protein [Gemmataceae bacterium]
MIADLSYNHVGRYILEAGHTAQRWHADYGYDLTMQTHDQNGYVETGVVYWQLKASERLSAARGGIPFDADVRDVSLWIRERPPVILCLFDASARRGYYVHVQGYFLANPARRPRVGAKTVRVYCPEQQTVTRRAIGKIRELKDEFAQTYGLRVIR